MIYKDRSLMNGDGTIPPTLLAKCIEQHMKELPRLEKLDDYVDGRHEILKRYFEVPSPITAWWPTMRNIFPRSW